jgi:hypothetical protein
MAKQKARDGGGETIQIVILTLFMTGGGFALISLVLALFLVPARADEVDQQIQDAKALGELLAKNNQKSLMWDLRKRAKEAEKAEGSANLRSRVENQLGPLQGSVTVFPAKTEKKIGNTREESQKIDFKDVKLQQVFDFVARVKQENPSVQVGQLRISRPPNTRAGSGGDEDKWTVSATFYLYSTTSGGPRGPSKAEAEPAAEEQPAEEKSPEE